ncbi:MAG: GxxExxY protein [Anaerolineales bacterium]|nr:GxxExxY protein [Anaerolineales bacterium]
MPENAITQRIIKCAIEVHKQLGPGLLENMYENALTVEFELEGLSCKQQLAIPAIYKGRSLGDYRLDLLVEDMVIVEVKSVERFDPVFEAQLLTYLRLTKKRVGLLINFNTRLVKDGIKRFIL